MWGYNLNGGWGRAAKRHLSLEGVSQPKSTLHFRVFRKSVNLSYFMFYSQN